MAGESNDETNFPYKSFLTETQISELRKDFANGLSDNKKFSKTHLSKKTQSEGFILDLLDSLGVVDKTTGSLESFGK